MSSRALTGARLLSKDIPSTTGAYVQPLRNWTQTLNGWEPIQDNGLFGVFYETYWDLSAYQLDDLTLMPSAIELQDGMPYTIDDYVAPDFPEQMQIVDIISQERLDPLTIYTGLFGAGDLPGTPDDGNRCDWEQVLYCQYRLMLKQTGQGANPTYVFPATAGNFGSASPTTVKKLWVYRVITFIGMNPEEGFAINVPATRFILAANIVKEADLSYIMRQKRSYELGTQGD